VSAHAVCVNGHPSVASEYSHSRVIVIASVVSEKPIPGTADGYFLDGTTYTVRVSRQFLGSPTPTLELFSENSSGRFDMAIGTEYLLFIYQDRGRLLVDNCGNSVELSKSGDILKQVERRAAAVAEDNAPPDLSGTWVINPTKNQPPMDVADTEVIVVTCAAQRIQFHFTTNGKASEQTYTVDGNEHSQVQNAPVAYRGYSKAKWEGSILVTEMRVQMEDDPGRKEPFVHFTERWSLSSNGRVLTRTIDGPDPNKRILVYDKQ